MSYNGNFSSLWYYKFPNLWISTRYWYIETYYYDVLFIQIKTQEKRELSHDIGHQIQFGLCQVEWVSRSTVGQRQILKRENMQSQRLEKYCSLFAKSVVETWNYIFFILGVSCRIWPLTNWVKACLCI